MQVRAVQVSRPAVGLAMIAATVIAFVAGCTSGDEARIDAQNTAASGGARGTPRTGEDEVSVFDLREGDCISDVSGSEAQSIDVVPCSDADALGRVRGLHLLTQPDGADFPGGDVIEAQAEEACALPSGAYTWLVPLEDSWNAGDRTITCIELLGFDYRVGSCIGPAEEGHMLTECGGADVFGEVTALVDLSGTYGEGSQYPAETVFDEAFDAQCADGGADYFLFPTAETWEVGDRLVVCVLMST